MKRVLLLVVALCICVTSALAQDVEQDKIWKKRAGYLNLGYVTQELSVTDGIPFVLNNDWGASISSGRTFYLHKKPIMQMMKFGLDWTWFDLNGSGYSVPGYDEYDGEYNSELYQAEIGMQVGPSITINPVHHLKISAYFRVAPCYSAVYNVDEESVFGSYSTFINAGASVAWKVISVGVEYRTGRAKYKELTDSEDEYGSTNQKYKTSGIKFYIGFRF